ncbi:MAG: cytoplasmic protein [SAR324 cluster bacterium]|uniref:Cytoplasmic protein n=1 Tax=SAR324 cluster bacterium TaxID=2024889 RepID=A0A7X9FP04_9DELT|nr:cytoplasmic protein [SAR324 cluster bacterium]
MVRKEQEASYRDFQATELFCPKCQRAVPVKERHLLYLPTGDLFDYICTVCGESLGTRSTST